MGIAHGPSERHGATATLKRVARLRSEVGMQGRRRVQRCGGKNAGAAGLALCGQSG
jgi:hypothetical protein